MCIVVLEDVSLWWRARSAFEFEPKAFVPSLETSKSDLTSTFTYYITYNHHFLTSCAILCVLADYTPI